MGKWITVGVSCYGVAGLLLLMVDWHTGIYCIAVLRMLHFCSFCDVFCNTAGYEDIL